MKLFIDTWGWVNIHNKREPRHREVKRLYRNYRDQRGLVFTTDYVLDETLTMLFRKAWQAGKVPNRYAHEVVDRSRGEALWQCFAPTGRHRLRRGRADPRPDRARDRGRPVVSRRDARAGGPPPSSVSKELLLVYLIKELVGFEGEVEWDKSKPDGQPKRRLDTTKAAKEFGFVARTHLRV